MIHLILPLPDSPNAWPSHPQARHRKKNAYRRTAWVDAVSRQKPFRTPPDYAEVTAIFFLPTERDEDNLTASMKWVLDTLKQEQRGNLFWRQSLYDRCGYFIDDDPKHMRLGTVRQVVDRKNPRLEVIIGYETEDEAA